jgi:hypothetical protein
MPKVRLDLDLETFEALAGKAFAERRPVPYQAEVILRQALGLQFPYPDGESGSPSSQQVPRLPHG